MWCFKILKIQLVSANSRLHFNPNRLLGAVILNLSRLLESTWFHVMMLRPGEEAGVEAGQRRFFMSHGGCRDGVQLQQGSQYLIMGPKEDLWNVDSDTNR